MHKLVPALLLFVMQINFNFNLCALFARIIKHGHVPNDFKHGVIIPVIKDNRKGPGDVDNYRPITIISVFSKLFEICLYNKINGCLNVSGLQLGFVKEGGCDKSLYTVSNVVNYFLKKSSDVFNRNFRCFISV